MNTSTQEQQIEKLIAKYSPEIAAQLRAARAWLRSLFPRGFELVFDNYNALVFAISANEQASVAFVSIAGYPRWVTLFFSHGAQLVDTEGLLQGTGKQVRSVRLDASATIQRQALKSLITQAAQPHQSELRSASPLTTIIKTVVVKQRPRRPTTGTTTATVKHRRADK
jgi:hypothetical protein